MKQKIYMDVSGSVAFRIVLCAVSIVVLVVAIFLVLGKFKNDQNEDLRLARRFSEDGLQEAFIKLTESPDWSTGFVGEPYDESGGSYSVEFYREVRDGILHLTVTSIGQSGAITQTTERTVQFVAKVSGDGDTTWVPMNSVEETPALDTEMAGEGDALQDDNNTAAEVTDNAQ